MAALLLELFSEEIPSRMQRGAMEQLQRLITAGFDKAGLKPETIRTFVSPRHLAIQVAGLPLVQPDVKEERKGPKVGAPEQAMKGFLTAVGLTAEQCEQRDGYYFATIEKKGGPVAGVLKEIIETALNAFGWPKSMKWGAHALQWVRPLHRIVALLDEQVIPVTFGHLTASNITEGHRFLAPAPITLKHAEHYAETLATAHVMVDYAARRGAIESAVNTLAATAGLQVHPDEALLDEVTGLVEWPVPLLCQFDKKFLDLPPEVLISEMKNHQRYFALRTKDGNLSDQFITVANMVTGDKGAKVREGNARVVRARLADGEFYWAQDQKTKLEDWGKKLSDVVFHAKVGMMDEKVKRIGRMALFIAKEIGLPEAEKVNLIWASQLAKADLTSGMVGEFPELQGIMGRYYALSEGIPREVADAIREHYKPVGANDSLPQSTLGSLISIADKLDSIVSLFAAGEKPTGSKDPLALRRAALGILKIIQAKEYEVDLELMVGTNTVGYLLQRHESLKSKTAHAVTTATSQISAVGNKVFDEAVEQYLKEADSQKTISIVDAQSELFFRVRDEVIEFFRDRLKTILKDDGIRHDIIEATLGIANERGFKPYFITQRAHELQQWVATETGSAALAALKRTLNILAAEEKKAKTTFTENSIIIDALPLPVEKKLWQLAQHTRDTKHTALEQFTAPINQFFTDVLVTEPEFRDARLSLLASIRATASSIADFSKIEG